MYSKLIAVGRLQEGAVMHSGDVKDIITFRLYPDNTQVSENNTGSIPTLECRYEVFRGDDYLLALRPGTIVFVEGDVFISKNQETMLECIVKKIFMIVEQKMSYQS